MDTESLELFLENGPGTLTIVLDQGRLKGTLTNSLDDVIAEARRDYMDELLEELNRQAWLTEEEEEEDEDD